MSGPYIINEIEITNNSAVLNFTITKCINDRDELRMLVAECFSLFTKYAHNNTDPKILAYDLDGKEHDFLSSGSIKGWFYTFDNKKWIIKDKRIYEDEHNESN